MPKLEITTSSKYIETFRTAKIAGMFDVPVTDKIEKKWNVDIPCEDKEWNIGLIVGPSGCGKTTIGKQIFGENSYHQEYKWAKDEPFIDSFPKNISIKDIVSALSSVGFSSPPQWLLPYNALSNGQKFRTEMARMLLENKPVTVIDEFTSVIDRNVAKISSTAISKAVRRNKKQIVALSCHYDIKEWLEPDWVYEVVDNQFKWVHLRRPKIKLQISRCSYKAWELFKGHHYLSADISKAAKCFIAEIENDPVGFCAAKNFVHPKVKNTMRGHRTVVLPDYQGVGIGNILSEHVGQYFIDQGKKYISTTSHPAMIKHRINSKLWIMYRKPGRVAQPKNNTQKHSANRLTASFEYVGGVD